MGGICREWEMRRGDVRGVERADGEKMWDWTPRDPMPDEMGEADRGIAASDQVNSLRAQDLCDSKHVHAIAQPPVALRTPRRR